MAPRDVCAKASKCPYQSIGAAIAAAEPGATITIGKGTYVENVVVNKPLTLEGSGKGTVIEPAVSNPVCGGGSLCGGAASDIVLVEADNVTITNLRLEGDNPGLSSGVTVGGKDVDARNGIITNYESGAYSGLTVSKVTAEDVYLRGIYDATGSFDFNHDTVENVQGEEESIAMFAWEGPGSMDENRVSNANDAISANWSKGIEFARNTVTNSGSGVHTDNNGGSGGSADVITGNKISECKEGGYGIFVFVPYVSATVSDNTVTGCHVGLAAFGGAVSGQGPTFSGNKVTGGGYGVYLTTDQLGFGFGDLTATLSDNTIEGNSTGLFVTQTEPTPGQPAGGQATVSAHGNAFKHDPGGAVGGPGTVVEAQSSWWGCRQGPNNSPKCDPASGTVAYTPWLTARP
jgi:nitrous oxidase accessory protein NosD